MAEINENKVLSEWPDEWKNPMKAIRARCLDCCCYQAEEVKHCTCTDCACWAFRLGKNPFRAKRELTQEQKDELAARLRKNKV